MDTLRGYSLIAKAMNDNEHMVTVDPDNELNAALRACLNADSIYEDGDWERALFIKVDGKGVGTASEPDVDAILAAGSPSNFGLGSETVHDENVRKSLDIPVDRFSLYWDDEEPADLRDDVDLGSTLDQFFGMPVKCVPYKINVHRPGDFFKEHVDTVRDERHVGTLVLVLGSKHEGGYLSLHLDEQKARIYTDSMGDKPWYVVFPTDVRHEIAPITSGIRLTLVFNVLALTKEELAECDDIEDSERTLGELVQEVWYDESDPVSSAHQDDGPPSSPERYVSCPSQQEKFRRLVQLLEKRIGPTALMLRHRYALASLKVECLKGVDLALVTELRKRWPCAVSPMILRSSKYGEEGELEVSATLAHRSLLTGEAKDWGSLLEPPAKRARQPTLRVVQSATPMWLLLHESGAEYTGNESAPERFAYWFSAVIVDLDNPLPVS